LCNNTTIRNSKSNTNVAYLADVEDDIASGDIGQATIDLSLVDLSNIFVDTTQHDSLVGTFMQEENRFAVLNVYLQSWALDSLVLTDKQVSILMPIANQGAVTGGMSVFDARNMLGIEVNDSSNLRMAHPHTIQDISTSHLYPNPTTGQISIVADLSEGQNGTLIIFDLAGRKVASWQMTGGQSVYTFDVSMLPSGTYIYQLSTSDKMIATERMIIIKPE
jgi:hypothetical protein